jgi:hypothetical protein
MLTQGERLQGIIKQREYASRRAERAYHAKYWSPQFFISLSFRNANKEDTALRKVRDYITQLARHKGREERGKRKEGLGRHIFGFGWADYQPERKLNTNEDSMHFHLFVEVDGGLPPNFERKLDMDSGSRICPLFGRNWVHGDSYVVRYTPELYGETYAAVGHKEYLELIGCPSRNRQCKKKHDGRTCVYAKDRRTFLERNR